MPFGILYVRRIHYSREFIAIHEERQYACLMLLISAIFVLIVGVTYFIPFVLPGLVIVAVGAGASVAVSKIVFRMIGAPEQSDERPSMGMRS